MDDCTAPTAPQQKETTAAVATRTARKLARGLSTALTVLCKPFTLLAAYILQLFRTAASAAAGLFTPILLKVLLSAAIKLEDAELVNVLLNDGSALVSSTSKPSSKPIMLMSAISRGGDPQDVAKTVKVLLSKPSATQTISPDVLHQALMAAVQQQNYMLVELLLKVPAAKAALGITGDSGKGLVYAAVTASTPPRQQLGPLIECLYTSLPYLRRKQLSEALAVVYLKERIASKVLVSTAAAGAAYTDLMAAAQHLVHQLVQPVFSEHTEKQFTTANGIFSQLASVLAENGHSTEEIEQLVLQHVFLPERQGGLLMQSAHYWSAHIRKAVAELASVEAERASYQYALTSLSAEQARLEKLAATDDVSMPGHDQSACQLLHKSAVGSPTAAKPGPCSRIEALRAAVLKGNLAVVKQLLAVQSVWPSLALNKEGSQLLKLAVPGSLEVFKVLLEAVTAATQATAAFTIAISAEAAANFGELKVSLALSVSDLGGPAFMLALANSPLAPTAQQWASRLKAAMAAEQDEVTVACVKGYVLCPNPRDPKNEREVFRALMVAEHDDDALIPPGLLVFAVINSCAVGLKQQQEAAESLRRAMKQGQAHFLCRLAVVYRSVTGFRDQLKLA